MNKSSLLLYAVTDRSWLGERTLYQCVKQALEGGCTMVQLREKELCYDAFLAEAKNLKALCDQYSVPFIINDNVDIAIACNADGIHVGQSDMNVATVRKLIGNDKIIGVSAQTKEQALMAVNDGADYLGVGAVFTTSTKKDASDVSLKSLADICNAVSIPVCAIGGITGENIAELKHSGIDGVAVVSAIFAQTDIKQASQNLLTLIKNSL